MLQLKNNTPFAADIALFPNEEGVDTLYLMVKATFKIGEQWSLTDQQLPPTQADEYWADPASSSIKYMSDYHTGKCCSDIVMIGHAFAPDGKAVTQLDVRLAVETVNKTIRVFGDRQWNNGRISYPVPFQSMPMVYERAYGGQFSVDGQCDSETSNPVGLGYVGKRAKEQTNGLFLPNLENPAELISCLTDRPKPACFAAIAPYWSPRSSFAGTYDEQWQITRAPYLPLDFDKRFFNVADADLIYPEFLRGGERVEISNMHPQGKLKFKIPHVQLKSEIKIADDIMTPHFNLETLLLEPNDLTISMVWRASQVCDKKVTKTDHVKISMAR